MVSHSIGKTSQLQYTRNNTNYEIHIHTVIKETLLGGIRFIKL